MLLIALGTAVGQQAARVSAETAAVCPAEVVDKMAWHLHTGWPVVFVDSTAAGNRRFASVAVASVHNLLSDQHTDGHKSVHRSHSLCSQWYYLIDHCQRLCTERMHYAAQDRSNQSGNISKIARIIHKAQRKNLWIPVKEHHELEQDT